MSNNIVTAIQTEAEQLMGGYLIAMAHEASVLAEERTRRAEQAQDTEARIEAHRTAASWLEQFSSKVVEDKAQMAMETLDTLPATASMAVCRHMMKAGARQAFRAYRAHLRQEELERVEHAGDAERPEADSEPYPNQDQGFEYRGPSFPVVELLTEQLHVMLDGHHLTAQQAMFGRRTSFNSYRFNDLPVGWVGKDGEDEPTAYHDLPSYLQALEEAIAASEEQRVVELREARKGGIDFSQFAA